MYFSHKQKAIKIDGSIVKVDAVIAQDIERINARGLRTEFSCQGDNPNVGVAYIVFTLNEKKALLDKIKQTAYRAGFEVCADFRLTIYSKPGIHSDAVREHCTKEQLLEWNAKFRTFLSDICNDSLDTTGQKYHVSFHIHDCTIIKNQDFVDDCLLPAYKKWVAIGGVITDLCGGDIIETDGRIVRACARWSAPDKTVPVNLHVALKAIGFEVRPWGIFTFRRTEREGEYSIIVSRERMLAMNAVFRIIFEDFSRDDIKTPDHYEKSLASIQRRLRKARAAA